MAPLSACIASHRIASKQDMHREFDASIPYMVSRVMVGYVEEVLSATDTLIITGDIEMDGMDVSRKY